MDHLPEWADFPCPYALQEEPDITEAEEESRFTPRADGHLPTGEQLAWNYFKQSRWSWRHQSDYESWDNYSAGNQFGDLPYADDSTRMYYKRYNPGYKGPGHPDVRRSNGPLHEKSKFNILRNPTDVRQRMEPWDLSDHRETPTELEEVAAKLQHYPRDANLPTVAPMMLRPGHAFKRPQNAQEDCAFAEFMAIPELRDLVMHDLPWEDQSNLSRTSQVFFVSMQHSFTHWDLTNQRFGNANYSPETLQNMMEQGGKRAEKAKSIMEEGKAPLNQVIVCPVRGVVIEGDHPRHTKMGKTRSSQYKADALKQLFRAIVLCGEHIHYIQLHRVEFLNVEAVEHMVDCMPNLKRLSILQCPLVHFAHTRKLVDITKEANDARGPRDRHMDLDFYPKSYLGPIQGRHGSYHILFQDDGAVDTRLAVVACLTTLIPYARSKGVELVKPGRAFRLWLDGFPFKYGTLEKILESIDNLEYHTPSREDRIIKAAKDDGNIRDDAHELALRRRMQDALHFDLYISAMGRPQSKKFMDSIEYSRCNTCSQGFLAKFFRSTQFGACHGCNLLYVLDRQYNHFLEERNALAARLWKDSNINCLADLMVDSTEKGVVAAKTWLKVQKKAKALDTTVKTRYQEDLKYQDEKIEMANQQLLATTTDVEAKKLQSMIYLRTVEKRRLCTMLGLQHRAPRDHPPAACWDRERREFNLLLQTERGYITKKSPHEGLNNQNWL